VIFDTNVLIYLSKNLLKIEDLITSDTKQAISVISYIETLGFPFATAEDYVYMKKICSSFIVIPLSDPIVSETISLRKNYKIKLPDAIIYSTAIVEKTPLLTHNVKDFQFLKSGVELLDPFNL